VEIDLNLIFEVNIYAEIPVMLGF